MAHEEFKAKNSKQSRCKIKFIGVMKKPPAGGFFMTDCA
jgi:hypothetical protein